MDIQDYFQENLVFFMNESDSNSTLEKMADNLEEQGVVKSTFKKALLEREEKFPTGLSVGEYGVAIPHSDSEHIERASIPISILEKPISFNQMDNKEKVDVQIVFMLCVKNPEEQVDILQKIISLIQDKVTINNLLQSKTKKEVISSLNKYISI